MRGLLLCLGLMIVSTVAHVCDNDVKSNCTVATECLQSLINEAAKVNGTVELPCGLIRTGVLILASGVHLFGAPGVPDCPPTILSACDADANGQKTLVEMGSGTNQVVSGITFDMGSVDLTPPNYDNLVALLCRGRCDNFLIERNEFINLPTRTPHDEPLPDGEGQMNSHAVLITAGSGTVSANHVHQSGGDGLNFNCGNPANPAMQCEYIIKDNTVENVGDGCIALNNNAMGIVSNNIIRYCNLGIGAGPSGFNTSASNITSFQIIGNRIEDSNYGMLLGWFGYAGRLGPIASVASDNEILRCRVQGIGYGGAGPVAQDNAAVHWKVSNNLVAQSGFTQTKSTCDNSTGSLFACCPPNGCAPWHREGGEGVGISVSDADSVHINGNTVEGCLGDGIRASGTNIFINGNAVTRNQDTGSSSSSGVHLQSSQHTFVANNRVRGYLAASLLIDDQVVDAAVTGNQLDGADTGTKSLPCMAIGDDSLRLEGNENIMSNCNGILVGSNATSLVLRGNTIFGGCVKYGGTQPQTSLVEGNACM